MKIAILGTRGIPNYHGGFEQFAEYFSVFLASHGHDVFVYNSSSHPYQKHLYKGVNLVHCKDPENAIGTFGQFIYDFNCIKDSRTRDFDIILQLGYTSSSIWYKYLPKKPIIITNMDGLEWKRSKYSRLVQKFLKMAEKWAVKSSDHLVADSLGIQNYLKNSYHVDSRYIAYGAETFQLPDENILTIYGVKPSSYNMLIARLEPENNIEMILDGVVASNCKLPFLVIGKHDVNSFGLYLKDKYKAYNHVKFLGGIYDINHLNNLRYYSQKYFHGHSVGGTNPSLLEAMASKAFILAHENEFNKSILKNNALFFSSSSDIRNFLESTDKINYMDMVENCYNDVKQHYSWKNINTKYLDLFEECVRETSDV